MCINFYFYVHCGRLDTIFIFVHTSGKMLGISCAHALHTCESGVCLAATSERGQNQNRDGIGKIEQVYGVKGKTSEECEWVDIFILLGLLSSTITVALHRTAVSTELVVVCSVLFRAWCVRAKLCNSHSKNRAQKKISLYQMRSTHKLQWQIEF